MAESIRSREHRHTGATAAFQENPGIGMLLAPLLASFRHCNFRKSKLPKPRNCLGIKPGFLINSSIELIHVVVTGSERQPSE